MIPLLHAGGFSWDEAIVLGVAILAVPALMWMTSWWERRKPEDSAPPATSQEPPAESSTVADDGTSGE